MIFFTKIRKAILYDLAWSNNNIFYNIRWCQTTVYAGLLLQKSGYLFINFEII